MSNCVAFHRQKQNKTRPKVQVTYDSVERNRTPFALGLSFDLDDARHRIGDHVLVDGQTHVVVEEADARPVELDARARLRIVGIFARMPHHDLPERLAHEVLAVLVALDDEAERGKLTAAVADQLVRQRLRIGALQAQRLQTRECGT